MLYANNLLSVVRPPIPTAFIICNPFEKNIKWYLLKTECESLLKQNDFSILMWTLFWRHQLKEFTTAITNIKRDKPIRMKFE
jgi:hypothetical protein